MRAAGPIGPKDMCGNLCRKERRSMAEGAGFGLWSAAVRGPQDHWFSRGAPCVHSLARYACGG